MSMALLVCLHGRGFEMDNLRDAANRRHDEAVSLDTEGDMEMDEGVMFQCSGQYYIDVATISDHCVDRPL